MVCLYIRCASPLQYRPDAETESEETVLADTPQHKTPSSLPSYRVVLLCYGSGADTPPRTVVRWYCYRPLLFESSTFECARLPHCATQPGPPSRFKLILSRPPLRSLQRLMVSCSYPRPRNRPLITITVPITLGWTRRSRQQGFTALIVDGRAPTLADDGGAPAFASPAYPGHAESREEARCGYRC